MDIHGRVAQTNGRLEAAKVGVTVETICGQRMVHGKSAHSTTDQQDAIARGYQYLDKNGKKVINQAGNVYFHPHYVSVDHKLNKDRCPERMFESVSFWVIQRAIAYSVVTTGSAIFSIPD